MKFAYDLIFLVVALVYLPVYLFKGKFHRGILRRLGFLPRGLLLNRPVWVHAVSVGEAVLVKGLVEELRRLYPDKQFVISTVTPTGNRIAKTLARENDFGTYLPFDFSFITGPVIKKINPCLFILAETELWPNLISCLAQRKIPVAIVNGRISDRSFQGYLRVKFLVKSVLDKVNLFCVQSVRDAERLICLGVDPEKIKITGNMKFDFQVSSGHQQDYRQKLSLGQEDKLLVCGSTHPQEEEIILRAYKKLLPDFPGLKLLLAPRHPDRAKQIAKLVSGYGFQPVFISNLPLTAYNAYQLTAVFILDTIGELTSFYSVADLVFVGGSLIKKGGHNILEPAGLGKAVIFGQYMHNFRDIAGLFLEKKAALQARDAEELYVKIKELLNNHEECLRLGTAAEELIYNNRGATQKTARLLKELINHA